MYLNQLHARQKSQQGAALIAVLVILVVITLLGVTAMRMSLTGLTLATNSQISGLLFEAADKGMVDVVGRPIDAVYADLDAAGAAVVGTSQLEIKYCVTGNSTNILVSTCDPSLSSNFFSPRKITVTQVNVIRKAPQETTSLGTGTLAQNTASTAPAHDDMKYSSTTVMPTIGSASIGQIAACLKLKSDDTAVPTDTTVTDCLTDSGAVFTTHVQDFKSGFFD